MNDVVTNVMDAVPAIQMALHHAYPLDMFEFRSGWLGNERRKQIRMSVNKLLHNYPTVVREDMRRIMPFLTEHRTGQGLRYRTLSSLSGKSVVTLKRAVRAGILHRTGHGLYAEFDETEAIPYCFYAPLANCGRERAIGILWRILFRDSRLVPLSQLTGADTTAMCLPSCVPAIPIAFHRALSTLSSWDIRLLTAIHLAKPDVIHTSKLCKNSMNDEDDDVCDSVIELFYSRDVNTDSEILLDHKNRSIGIRQPWQVGAQLILDGTLKRWCKERDIGESWLASEMTHFSRCPKCETPYRGTYKRRIIQIPERQTHYEGKPEEAGDNKIVHEMRCQECGYEYNIEIREFQDHFNNLRQNLDSINKSPGNTVFTNEQINGLIKYTQRRYLVAGGNAPDEIIQKGHRRPYHRWERQGQRRGTILGVAIAMGNIDQDQIRNAKTRNVACTSVRNALNRITKSPTREIRFINAIKTINNLAHEIETNCWRDLWLVLPATFSKKISDMFHNLT